MMVFGAVDIGSNAVRLHISNVFENGDKAIFKKGSIVRVPIRLGEDAFLEGAITREKADKLLKAMRAFRHLIDIYEPVDYLACATSAMRCAENGREIVERIRGETGIDVTIIDGQREAEIVYSNHIAEEMTSGRSYLYIEVGGGSTELTLFSDNTRVFSRSFPIGTVRILHDLVDDDMWKEMKGWLKARTAGYRPLVGIGSGGNINFMFKISRKKEGRPLTYKKMKSLHRHLSSHTLDERIKVLGVRPDRADVVIPANEIFLSIMKWVDIEELYVPRINVADGIIHLLYEKHRFRRVVDFFGQE